MLPLSLSSSIEGDNTDDMHVDTLFVGTSGVDDW